MALYAVRRILAMGLVLLGVSVLVFLTLHLRPGDPALIMLGPHATDEALAELRHQMGLDLPLPTQFARWLAGLLHGDWGRSIQLKTPVLPLVLERWANSAWLAVFGTAIAVVAGVPVGLVSAVRRRSLLDRAAMVAVLVGFSVPVFWLGLLLQLAFGLHLGWFPVAGMKEPGEPATWAGFLRHAALPAVTLAAGPGAVIARMTRSAMLEALAEDYVRTARAKGVPPAGVVLRHALKNALIPVVTIVGMQVGYLLSGEILLEIVFGWPGLGLLMINGILAQDFPVVQGAILLVAASYVLVNLAVDLAYAALDPRISYGAGPA